MAIGKRVKRRKRGGGEGDPHSQAYKTQIRIHFGFFQSGRMEIKNKNKYKYKYKNTKLWVEVEVMTRNKYLDK